MNRAIFDEALAQAKLKVQRARRHTSEAEFHLREYLATDFCQLREELDPQTNGQFFRVVASDLPMDVALAIGDAFHNLSVALDYVSTDLFRAINGSAKRVTFPLDDTRQALRQSFKRPAPGKGAPRNRKIVEQFSSFVWLIMNKIKPYKGGDFLAWEVRRADNIDKHNLITPTLTIASLTGMSLVDIKNHNYFHNMSAYVHAGAVIPMIAYSAGARLEIIDKGNATISITFPKNAEVFAGEPVFPTMLRCIKAIENLLTIVERADIRLFCRENNTRSHKSSL